MQGQRSVPDNWPCARHLEAHGEFAWSDVATPALVDACRSPRPGTEHTAAPAGAVGPRRVLAGLVGDVLSIAKLVAGQARYYLDQAEGRVDVVDSIGEGLEDYYGGGGESRGDWIGSASRELGLEHAVVGTQLRRVLALLDRADGSPLRRAPSRLKVGGFDLTFSAPKSVSVLFGVGDSEVRDAIRAAHDMAVREAIGYLERSAAAVRRGHGGAVVEQASGLVAAAFRHRTSRAGDPQLHTHVLVANLGRGLDVEAAVRAARERV